MKKRPTVLLGLLLAGAAAAPATALPPKYETYAARDYFVVECGQEDAVIIVPISRAYRPTRLDGPELGETLYNRSGDPVAIVIGIERARDLSGGVGLRWTVEGSGVACEEEREFRTVSYRFEIEWRIPRSELQHNCGKVRMLFTRSVVAANGYVPTCRKARSVAQGWSRYQEADNGIHPMIKFSSPVTIRGYRCAAPRSENYTLWVNCRRGRARVYWEWGD